MLSVWSGLRPDASLAFGKLGPRYLKSENMDKQTDRQKNRQTDISIYKKHWPRGPMLWKLIFNNTSTFVFVKREQFKMYVAQKMLNDCFLLLQTIFTQLASSSRNVCVFFLFFFFNPNPTNAVKRSTINKYIYIYIFFLIVSSIFRLCNQLACLLVYTPIQLDN